MVVTCDIEFDENRLGTFFAGQLFSGSVTLKSDKPKDVKAVLVTVIGYTVTKWSERQFTGSKLYVGREEYLKSLTYLLGNEQNNNNKLVIERGTHTYKFGCQLPQDCPSSFEGKHGCIRYIVKVTLVRPWKFDQIYTRGLTVLQLLDLNFESPQIRIPSNSEAYRAFCCGPCRTAPLQMSVHLPQSGYVPGQRIAVTTIVINNTNLSVPEVKVSLVMLVRYRSMKPKHECIESITVTEAKCDSVLRCSTRSLSVNLQVPSTPPTCMAIGNLIQIAYHVEVEAGVRFTRDKQLVKIPVIIGVLPLALSGVVTQQPLTEQHRRLSKGTFTLNGNELPLITSIASTTPNVVTPNAEDLPPPVYTESLHTVRGNINEDELHAFGPNEFSPLYPVYNISSPNPKVSKTQDENCNDDEGEGKTYINKNFIE